MAGLILTGARRLGLALLTKAADVLHPGSRGGQFWIDQHGKVRYGPRPAGAKPFRGEQSRVQLALKLRQKSGFFSGRELGAAGHTAAATAQIFREVTDLDRERFWVLHLNRDHVPTAVECISQGSLNASIVTGRETFRNALQMRTAAVAFVHNHPSGVPNPSPEDFQVNTKLRRLGQAIGIEVLHHVIVGREGYADIENDVMPSGTNWAGTTDVARGKPLPMMEGRIGVRDPATWEGIFQLRLDGPSAVAAVGRQLLDPGDKVALAIATDTKHRVIGVFPLAHSQLTSATVDRLAATAIGAGAAKMAVVASQDGPEWMGQLDTMASTFRSILSDASIGYLDTVTVSADGGFRSELG